MGRSVNTFKEIDSVDIVLSLLLSAFGEACARTAIDIWKFSVKDFSVATTITGAWETSVGGVKLPSGIDVRIAPAWWNGDEYLTVSFKMNGIWTLNSLSLKNNVLAPSYKQKACTIPLAIGSYESLVEFIQSFLK